MSIAFRVTDNLLTRENIVPTLKPEVQTHIVKALACFDSPSQVVDSVREEFGLTLKRQSIQAYDPEKYAGRNLSKKWRALFEITRKRFLEDTSTIPIAQQAYRLQTLQRMLTSASGRGNAAVAAQLMEQAAKELGGAYTNRQRLEHDVPAGGPMAAFMEQIAASANNRLTIKK